MLTVALFSISQLRRPPTRINLKSDDVKELDEIVAARKAASKVSY